MTRGQVASSNLASDAHHLMAPGLVSWGYFVYTAKIPQISPRNFCYSSDFFLNNLLTKVPLIYHLRRVENPKITQRIEHLYVIRAALPPEPPCAKADAVGSKSAGGLMTYFLS